jgi:hypothetical protein
LKKRIDRYVLCLIVVCYSYMIVCAWAEDGKGLSFASFALWTVLTWISCITIKSQGGATPAVPMLYAMGATFMTLVLAYMHRYTTLTALDGFTAILVVLCIVLLIKHGKRGEKWALVISVTASTIAGIPYWILTYKFPLESPVLANIGFLIANITAFISAGRLPLKYWTIKDRLFTGVSIVSGVILILPWVWHVCTR